MAEGASDGFLGSISYCSTSPALKHFFKRGSALIPASFWMGTMKKQTEQELRGEIDRLLRQQAKFLESRRFGTATEAELHEYEIRQDLMRELWEKLVLSNHRMTFIQTGTWSHSSNAFWFVLLPF